jgi:hypothetical protein
MMFSEHLSREISDPHSDGGSVEYRHEDGSGVCAKSEVAWRATANRFAQLSFLNQAKSLKGCEPVRHNGARQIRFAFEIETGCSPPVAYQLKELSEAGLRDIDRLRSTNRPARRLLWRCGGGSGLTSIRHRCESPDCVLPANRRCTLLSAPIRAYESVLCNNGL